MRKPLALLALALLAALTQTGSAARATPDPGRQLAATLLTAAGAHDAGTIWSLLSTPSRRRLGPTFKAFEKRGAVQIERALVPFESPSVKLFVDQSLTSRFGIVAMRNRARALAFPLRREGKAWKIETPGPVSIQVLGPRPGSRGAVSQVAFQAGAPAAITDAVVFVDGKLYRPTLAYGPTKAVATVFASLPRPLARGTHIAVAYAEQGPNVSAQAWSFAAT